MAEITYADLVAAYFQLTPEERVNGEWVATYDVEETLRRTSDGSGRMIYTCDPLTGVRTLMGRRIRIDAYVDGNFGIQFLPGDSE